MSAAKAIYHALSRERAQVLIVSPSLRQSSLMFRKVRAFLQHNLVKGEIEAESQTMIIFKNGSEIHCLPGNNPDTVRGYSPTLLIIDEAAFVKDELYVAIEPALAATNGQMVLVSTPFGKRGRFYMACQPDSGFETYLTKSEESPLITEEFLNGMRASKTELEYRQEFEGEFLEEQDTYFPRELVLSMIDEDLDYRDHPESQREHYLGVDVARYGLDETTYIIAEVDKTQNVKIVFIKSTTKKPLTDVIGRVKALHALWDFKGIYIDATGIGAGSADVLKADGLPLKQLGSSVGDPNKHKAGIQFTLKNKEEMYKNLKLIMEQGRISCPKHDKLIFQMCELQYEFTEAGHLKLHHPDNGHDDYPDALALAVAGLIKGSYQPYISL